MSYFLYICLRHIYISPEVEATRILEIAQPRISAAGVNAEHEEFFH